MLKFMATSETGRKILGIGLSRGNVEKLLQALPIHFNAEQMGLPDLRVSDVMIFFGETEEAMRADFEKQGYLEGTRIIEDQGSRH